MLIHALILCGWRSRKKFRNLVQTHLRYFTFTQHRPASTHCTVPPDEASQLGWDWRGAPIGGFLTPCSTSVASQTALVTRWDYKLPVFKILNPPSWFENFPCGLPLTLLESDLRKGLRQRSLKRLKCVLVLNRDKS